MQVLVEEHILHILQGVGQGRVGVAGWGVSLPWCEEGRAGRKDSAGLVSDTVQAGRADFGYRHN